MENLNNYPAVLTIAGSDSGGGAGIQADIKSIAANGAYAASVITAVTAQNTTGVYDIYPLPINNIECQLKTVLDDIPFAAIKVGMLHSIEVIDAVQTALKHRTNSPLIIDPVMVATSGDKLISNQAIERLKYFLTEATLITPNLAEAEVLLGSPLSESHLEKDAQALSNYFRTSVLLKGGHKKNNHRVYDYLYSYNENTLTTISNPYINTKNTHGTGCSLSSSIAAQMAQGLSLTDATKKACAYVHSAIKSGKDKVLGQGNNPIDHFYFLK